MGYGRMITLEKCVELQEDIVDLCDTLDIEEEITNDLYQVVTKHYEEGILWAAWEKQHYAMFNKYPVKPKYWKPKYKE